MSDNRPIASPSPSGLSDLAKSRSFLGMLSRSQIAAAAATVIDFGTLFGLVELFGVYYVLAKGIGALLGAITNFVINRQWTFLAAQGSRSRQAKRYALVSAVSLALNTGGIFLVTELLNTHYGFSAALVSFAVGIFFNFPLHRYYVFKHDSNHPHQERHA